jgi:hypothetical protein
MSSVDISISVDLECDECGKSLKGYYTASGFMSGRVEQTVKVKPCEDCLEEAREEGGQNG